MNWKYETNKLRRVVFKDWQYNSELKRNVQVEIGEAWFHQFGTEILESQDGNVQYSTAIIELDDGTVKNIPVELIKFIKEE